VQVSLPKILAVEQGLRERKVRGHGFGRGRAPVEILAGVSEFQVTSCDLSLSINSLASRIVKSSTLSAA
jgi:hypothetical protein